jgi:DNA-directed RNA polymerase specialized sigma24 family protein
MTPTEPQLKVVPEASDDVSGEALSPADDTEVTAPATEEDVEAPSEAPIDEPAETSVEAPADAANDAPIGRKAPPAIDPELWADVDWQDLVPRLLLLALSRLSRMTWRGQRDAVPPGAAEAQDFVNDAIAKTLSGVRVWSKDKCTLFQHLAGVIVSDISHAAEASENKLTLAADSRKDRSDDWPPDKADEAPDQEQRMLWRSEQRRLLGHLDEVDPKLARMAELILLQDVDGSAELAEHLGCTTGEIANLRKRMKRALHVYMLAVEDPKL